MGEAWSDWYAMDFLNNQGFTAGHGRRRATSWSGHYVGRERPIRVRADGLPGRRAGTRRAARQPGRRLRRLHVRRLRPDHRRSPRCTPTARSGCRRSGRSARRSARSVDRDARHPGDGAVARQPVVSSTCGTPSCRPTRSSTAGDAPDPIWRSSRPRHGVLRRGRRRRTTPTRSRTSHLPPAPGTPTGSFAGRVLDDRNGGPIAGATVFFGGHASGFPGADLADSTDAQGRFAINGIFVGTYHDVAAFAPGYDRIALTRTIPASETSRHTFQVVRDWASALKGGSVTKFTGPDFTPDCGPINAIDQSQGQGWGSTTDLTRAAGRRRTRRRRSSSSCRSPRHHDLRRRPVQHVRRFAERLDGRLQDRDVGRRDDIHGRGHRHVHAERPRPGEHGHAGRRHHRGHPVRPLHHDQPAGLPDPRGIVPGRRSPAAISWT